MLKDSSLTLWKVSCLPGLFTSPVLLHSERTVIEAELVVFLNRMLHYNWGQGRLGGIWVRSSYRRSIATLAVHLSSCRVTYLHIWHILFCGPGFVHICLVPHKGRTASLRTDRSPMHQGQMDTDPGINHGCESLASRFDDDFSLHCEWSSRWIWTFGRIYLRLFHV